MRNIIVAMFLMLLVSGCASTGQSFYNAYQDDPMMGDDFDEDDEAPPPAPGSKSGTYIGGLIGSSFTIEDTDIAPGFDADLEAGFSGGVVVGHRFNPIDYSWFPFGPWFPFPQNKSLLARWRIEGEFTYRKQSVDSIDGEGVTTSSSGDYEAMAGMFNAILDFDTGSRFFPFLGGGIGLARVGLNDDIELNPTVGTGPITGPTTLDDDDTVLAFQLIAGFGYEVPLENGSALTLSTEYRYFFAEEPDLTTEPTVSANVEPDYENHNVMFTVRYTF